MVVSRPQSLAIDQGKDVARDDPLSPTTSVRSTVTNLAMNTKSKCPRKELLYKLGFEKNNIASSSGGSAAVLPSNREPSRGSLLGQVKTTTEALKYDENFHIEMAEKKQRALERKARRQSGTGNVFAALGSLFAATKPEEETVVATRDDDDDDDQMFKPSSLTSVETDATAATSSTSNSGDGNDESSSNTNNIGNTRRRRGLSFNDKVTVVPIPERHEYSKRIRDRLWINARELQSQAARNTVEFASEGWNWREALVDEDMYVCALTGEKVHPVHYDTMED